MTLAEYCKEEGRGVLTQLQRASGLAYSTVWDSKEGGSLESLEAARALSKATGGAVPVDALWGPGIRGEATATAQDSEAPDA